MLYLMVGVLVNKRNITMDNYQNFITTRTTAVHSR